MPQLKSKLEMYQAMRDGKFGNINPHWFDLESMFASGIQGRMGIRSLIPGGRCIYNVDYGCVRKHIHRNWPNGGYCISPMINSDTVLIQGEIYRGLNGLYLMYSKVKAPMRDALKQDSLHAERTKAKLILQHYLDDPSYENIERLLDEYEDAVIEFTTFAHPVGTLKLNTVIWEVRNY